MWLHNNIIAIIAVSFVVVGTIWGIGNVIHPPKIMKVKNSQGIFLFAQDNLFNATNPDIYAKVATPTGLTIVNKDLVRHDFIVDKLNINSAYLSTEQDFITAIASEKPGIFEYYCSLHPATMHGRIIVK
jgi:heme/copper-type cytochrome/quinol oxidase subunit 2